MAMDCTCPGTEVARRHFLGECGVGLGKIALASLLTGALPRRASGAEAASQQNLLAPKAPHFPAKAKRVIHLFMAGAPSQLDLFDYKPELAKFEGKPIPPSIIGGQRYAFIRPDAAVLGPRFKFAKHGQSGAELSEMLPHLAKIADDVCFVKSMKTDQFNHAPAQIFFNTGFSQPGRPSLGSWTLYGLGSEATELPAFVVMSTGLGISVTGNHKKNCGATDKASVALVTDLKQRGLLDDTLVVWSGEFGRTPMVESNKTLGRSLGRDHHPNAFTVWMAGGGVKRGFSYGATDELGFNVTENQVHIHDLQATILHLLGLDHEKLTYRYAGRDFRLTDVFGNVVKDLLA